MSELKNIIASSIVLVIQKVGKFKWIIGLALAVGVCIIYEKMNLEMRVNVLADAIFILIMIGGSAWYGLWRDSCEDEKEIKELKERITTLEESLKNKS